LTVFVFVSDVKRSTFESSGYTQVFKLTKSKLLVEGLMLLNFVFLHFLRLFKIFLEKGSSWFLFEKARKYFYEASPRKINHKCDAIFAETPDLRFGLGGLIMVIFPAILLNYAIMVILNLLEQNRI
jgi:hypothetical protein